MFDEAPPARSDAAAAPAAREPAWTRRVRTALALAVAGVITLLVALSTFAHPSADDFCFAVKVRDLGLASVQAHWFNGWSGRYTSNAALSAFPAAGDLLVIYPLAAVLVIVMTFASFAMLALSAGGRWFATGELLLAAGVLTLVYFAATPDPAQTFYWMSGSFTYQAGNIVYTLLVALLMWLERRSPTGAARMLALATAGVLAIVAVGTNEVTLALTLLTLACGCVVTIAAGRPTRRVWWALLGVGIAAAAVSVLAPGNAVRLASMPGDGMLRPAGAWAALAFIPWVGLRAAYWLSSVATWASAFLLFVATRERVTPLLDRGGRFDNRMLAIPALWLAAIFVLSGIGFLVNRYPLPERAESVVALVFVLGWYPSFIVLAHRVLGSRASTEVRSVPLASALLVVGLLGTPNVFEAYKDVYRGYRYHREMQARFDALRVAAKRGELDPVVGSLSRPPRTLFATDFVTDADNFRNTCAAQYFGVRSIRLGTSAP